MSKAIKKAIVDQLTETLGTEDSAVVVNVGALTAGESEDLRNVLREREISLFYLRNRLAAIAFKDTGFEGLEEVCNGPSAIAFGGDGALAISKILVAEAKKNKRVEVLGGFMDGEVLDSSSVDELSKVPGKEELLAMILSAFFGPVSELSRSMDGLLTEVHGLIDALEQKGGAAS